MQNSKSKKKTSADVLSGDNSPSFLYHAIHVHFVLAIQTGISCYIRGKCWHIREEDMHVLRNAAFFEGGGFGTVMCACGWA